MYNEVIQRKGMAVQKMIDYTGIKCPACGKPFEKQDDIVVCPDCGAPYHRSCYEEQGKCIFENQHGTGQTWKSPERAAQAAEEQQENRTKQCPRCRHMNYSNALFCDQCGLPLNENAPKGYPFGGIPGGAGGPVPFMLDPMGGVDPKEEIGGAPAGDIAKLVQNNTPYYMPVFSRIDKMNVSRFNFAAFLFSGGWLLYRKMYKIGAVITSVIALLYLASVYIELNYAYPLLNSMLSSMGASTGDAVTYDQVMKMMNILPSKSAGEILLFFAPTLMNIALFILMIVTGAVGNKLYYKHCVSTVDELKKQDKPADEYTAALQSRGGINTRLAVLLLVCYLIINWLPWMLT